MRELLVCLFIAGCVASSVAFSLTDPNTTMQLHTSKYPVSNVQYCRFSAKNNKRSLPEPVSNKTLYFSH